MRDSICISIFSSQWMLTCCLPFLQSHKQHHYGILLHVHRQDRELGPIRPIWKICKQPHERFQLIRIQPSAIHSVTNMNFNVYSLSVVDQDRVQHGLLLLQLPPSQHEDGVLGLGQPEQEARRRDRRHPQPISADRVILRSQEICRKKVMFTPPEVYTL